MITTLTLLTEPVALLLFACALSLWLTWRARTRRGCLLAALPIVVTALVCATPLGANALLAPLEDSAKRAALACPPTRDGDLIVLLSGGASGQARSAEDTASLHEASFRRALAAIDLGRGLPHSRLLISGGGRGAAPEEEILRHFVLQLGFPADRLLVEGGSRDTFESARAVRRILQQGTPGQVALVTTAAHMPRALASYHREGIEACARPTDFDRVDVSFPTFLLPQISAVRKSTVAMHEYVGWLAYRLSGRL